MHLLKQRKMDNPSNDKNRLITAQTDLFSGDTKAGSQLPAFSVSPTFEIEKELLKKSCSIIAGVDEAGRGPIAGPVSVGMVIYERSFILSPCKEIISRVNDSKKISSKKRSPILEIIKKYSLFCCVSSASHRIIDKTDINIATKTAIQNILKKADIKPDIILMDGNISFDLGIPVIPVKKGDSISYSIASASIAAKVSRDAIMTKFDRIYPQYDFKNNKGYGTKKHIEVIKKIGITPIHRISYEPVKSICSDSDGLLNL